MVTADKPEHDYARETRKGDSDTPEYRMRCSCGKVSRWSPTVAPVLDAQDRHADEVARRHRGGGIRW